MTATAHREWLTTVCGRLSQALGYDLSYEAGAADGSHRVVPDSHIVWRRSLFNGEQVTGQLRLAVPAHGPEPLPPAPHVVHAASVFADILERLVTAETLLESFDEEPLLDDLGEPGNAIETAPEIVRRMLRAAIRAARCWGAAFFLADPAAESLQLRASEVVSFAAVPQPKRLRRHSPDAHAMETGALTVRHTDPLGPNWLPTGCRGGLCVPVRTTEGALGTLWCYERRDLSWDERDLRRLKIVAAHLASGLERTVLLKESDARRQMSRELTHASVRHTPHAVGSLTPESGLDVAIRVASPAALGGDLCEVWPVGKGQTFFALGDATGHSVPAAMIMAVARGSLRTLLDSPAALAQGPDAITAQLNRALHSVTRGEQFMTFVCGLFDRRRRRLQYANAGHPPPWHIRQGRVLALPTHGMLLGVLPDTTYERGMVSLQAGDWLIGFTDGVSEALSVERELFRGTGVLNAFRAQTWATADQAADGIWAALHQHTQGAPAKDDQTLLVLRVTE